MSHFWDLKSICCYGGLEAIFCLLSLEKLQRLSQYDITITSPFFVHPVPYRHLLSLPALSTSTFLSHSFQYFAFKSTRCLLLGCLMLHVTRSSQLVFTSVLLLSVLYSFTLCIFLGEEGLCHQFFDCITLLQDTS